MTDALRAEIDALDWFHQIDFGNGLLTPGRIKQDKIERMSEIIFDMPLAGKSVLDIGCWDGAYSLEASKRGAARVLATDHFVWHHGESGRKPFDLVREHLAPTLEVRDIDVPELSVESVGKFDLVLFCGVLYHLRNPFDALERVAQIASECLVVETHLISFPWWKPYMRFWPGRELANDPTNWWSPNRLCVEAMLKELGFRRITFHHPDYRRRRGIFHARR